MPRASANPDITPRQFRDAWHDEGFAFLGGTVQRFVDLRFPQHRRYILPVTNARGQMLYAETLAALRASRAASEQERAKDAADHAALLKRALRLAPQAFAPPRAGLSDVEAIATLADDLRHANARESGVKRSDMLLLGWTRDQLDRYGEQARVAAYARAGGVA